VAEKIVAGRVDLEDPEYEITVVRGARRDYYSVTRSGVMRQDWIRRRPRGRAFFHPAAMFPKISRCLVNLTGVGEGGVILDPFVGTGSILLEADIVGADALGVDMSRKMVRGAKRNQEKFGQRWLGIVLADSRRLPLKQVDAIATDVPYGRASSTEGSATGVILDGLIAQSGQLLKGNGRLVVMHPLGVPASPDESFEVEGEHLIYVHRKLTRAITVMRRRR
jgi:tRNA (guanine10-N2)-dimethyltransferase